MNLSKYKVLGVACGLWIGIAAVSTLAGAGLLGGSSHSQRCEDIGSGACGGYNKDTKRNCDPGYRVHTYKCDDGTYREGCIRDTACD
jgi:hypothetical protein